MTLSQKNNSLFIIMVTRYYLKTQKCYEKYGIAYSIGNSRKFPGNLLSLSGISVRNSETPVSGFVRVLVLYMFNVMDELQCFPLIFYFDTCGLDM
jgi:hypothetical protein